MHFTESAEEARELAGAALRMMALHGVPPLPVNYTVWYAYQTARYPELNRALDRLIFSLVEITSDRCRDLFARYLAAEIAGTPSAGAGDPSTGLASRGAFDARLAQGIAGLWQTGGRLSLLLAEIDGLDAVAGRHGRPGRDGVAGAVGRALKNLLDSDQMAARFGAGSFAVILPLMGLADALAVAERFRVRLASGRLEHPETGEVYGRVALSAGVAEYRLGEPPALLIARAEAALAQARREGHGRVVPEVEPASGLGLAG
ncbi:MAG: diguanylate cyclase [Rhodospirillales bacterium]|nr:diguanylate cyclase [Rhodospirillales bacterium]